MRACTWSDASALRLCSHWASLHVQALWSCTVSRRVCTLQRNFRADPMAPVQERSLSPTYENRGLDIPLCNAA